MYVKNVQEVIEIAQETLAMAYKKTKDKMWSLDKT